MDVSGERWFVGRPHMGSPLDLSQEERANISVEQGDVFDANFNAPNWVLACHTDLTGAGAGEVRCG